jgi:hypothetical protein
MPSVSLVAIGRLHEDGRFGKTFCKDFSSNVVEPNPLADVAAGLLYDRVPVHVGQEAETKPKDEKKTCFFEIFSVVPVCTAYLSALLGSVNPSTVIEGWLA